MEGIRWRRVKDVFQETFERDPANRAAFLETACGSDLELRAAVEQLLRAHAGAAGFLEVPVAPSFDNLASLATARDDELTAVPARIGPYRVVSELGRGGMGTVYRAERDEPGLRKTVAIKLVRSGMDSTFVLRRFKNERQILSSLEHPGIARLYDGGTTDDGLPFFVMEYVDGTSLLSYCDEQRLSIADRLRLFRRVCNAVQYAHQSLVVHRDLKPSNILVTAEGHPKLLDFGIAKLLTPAIVGGSVEETTPFDRFLTPQYASPEQVRGEPVTTASDVYSLGAILYELMCGQRPYRITGQGAAEISRAVSEAEPPPPSTLLARTDARRRQLRGDLDNIVLKALRKDTGQRYATAAELGDDLQRHLDGFPVRAQPDRRAYRAKKFVRRHRAGVLAAGMAALSLVVGLTLALWQAQVARAERDRARAETEKAQQVTGFLRSLFQSSYAKQAKGETLTARDLLDAGRERVDRDLANQPVVRASMLALLGSVYSDLNLYAQAEPLLERSLALREQVLGRDHSDVAESLSALGRLKGDLGDLEGAQTFLERAVAVRETVDGRDAPALAETLSQLGNVQWARGHYAEGRPMLARAVAIEEKHVGPNLLKWLTNLSNFDVAVGDLESAQRLLERALRIGEGLGGGDLQVDVTLLNLATVLRQQEDFAGSKSLLERALVTTEKVYGSEHRAMLYTLAECGELNFAMGDNQKAIEFIQRSLEIGERVLGPDHAALASPLTYLARVRASEGKPADALPALERALRLREKAFGRNNRDVAETLVDIAEVQVLLRRPAAAEPMLREALAIQRRVLVPAHRDLVHTLTVLGGIEIQNSRPADAAALLDEAVQIARTRLPARHSRRLQAEKALRDASRAGER